MFLDVFETIIDALTRWSNGVGLSLIVVISLGLVLLTIIISFIATQASIERKTTKAVARVSNYLEKHPFITEENLVEFNKLMKHIPNHMRSQWQQYMVNRDKKPSEFFSDDNCIEKPFKASAYTSHIVATRAFSIVVAIVSLVFSLAFYTKASTDGAFSYEAILSSLLVSSVDIIVCEIYLFFLKARRNSLISELYASFNNFRKGIDRAVTTLPDYVDYEILFTRKEITAGIPVLQEYLEQRARYEQEQIKKAKESEVVHENYDFSALGINGSLVMEKAMRECEYFIGNKKRILAEVSEIESARDMLDKNYDEKNKTTQRKLRDIKESLERLKEKLDATTNLIVGNDLRKQRENEIQKQRQLEKESDEDNKKYEEEKKKLTEQVESKRGEIEGFRKSIEVALNNEFMRYADKIYSEIEQKLIAENKEHMDTLSAEVVTLQQALEDKDRIIIEKSTILNEKGGDVAERENRIAELEKFIEENQLNDKSGALGAKNKEIFAVKKELESRNIELEKKEKQIERQKEYIDELKSKKNVSGDQIYTDENGALYFVDAYGNRNYVTRVDNSSEEHNVAEVNQEEQPVQQIFDNEQFEQELNEPVAEPEPENNGETVEANSSLGFSDLDLIFGDEQQVAEESKPEVEEAQEVPAEAPVAEPVEIPAENYEENEVTEIDHAALIAELFGDTNEEPVAEPKAEEEKVEEQPAEEVAEPLAEEKAVDIDDLDKLIEEKNAELEKQQETLSKQLEETQNIAEAEEPKEAKPKEEVKGAEAVEEKKPLPKKKKSSGDAGAKPAKPAAKKPAAKKPAAKKPAAKSAAKKPAAKKAGESKAGKKAINVNLSQFNNQLKKMMKDGKKGK